MELKLQTKLSPLQIQTIKLIELPIQELEQRIRKELEENPVLEEDTSLEESKSKDVSLDEYKAMTLRPTNCMSTITGRTRDPNTTLSP